MYNLLETQVSTIDSLKSSIVDTFTNHYGLDFDGSDVQTEAYLSLYHYWVLKAKRFSRTLQFIRKHGIMDAIDELVSRDGVSEGFSQFSENGMLDRTFEFVVLKHPSYFSDRAKLKAIGRII